MRRIMPAMLSCRYGIRPKDWAEMTTPERMFCCAVIEMEIAAEEKR